MAGEKAKSFYSTLERAIPKSGGKPSTLAIRTTLAGITGVDPRHINLKLISAANQVSPRTSESRANRFRAGSPPDWILGALVTAPPEQRRTVIEAVKREATTFATLVPVFVRDDSWRLEECLFDVGHRASAARLQEWFGLPDDRMREFANSASSAGQATTHAGGDLLVIADADLQRIVARLVANALAEIRSASTKITVAKDIEE